MTRGETIVTSSDLEHRLHAFEAWGWDARGWSKNTRVSYKREAKRAHRWLRDNRNVSLVRARTPDEAYLFSTPPNPRTRRPSGLTIRSIR
jgi:site-specific recombinase XerD